MRGMTYLVKVALHYSYISRQGFEVIVNLLRAQISSAQDVLDLARDLSEPQRLGSISVRKTRTYEHLAELSRQVMRAVRDVKVADHQHKLRENQARRIACK